MSSTSRRSQGPPVDAEVIAAAVAIGVVIGVGLAVALGAHVAAAIDGRARARSRSTRSPLVIGLVKHTVSWPPYATAITARDLRAAGRRARATCGSLICRLDGHVDRAARWMGRGKTIATLSEKAVREKAKSLRG